MGAVSAPLLILEGCNLLAKGRLVLHEILDEWLAHGCGGSDGRLWSSERLWNGPKPRASCCPQTREKQRPPWNPKGRRDSKIKSKGRRPVPSTRSERASRQKRPGQGVNAPDAIRARGGQTIATEEFGSVQTMTSRQPGASGRGLFILSDSTSEVGPLCSTPPPPLMRPDPASWCDWGSRGRGNTWDRTACRCRYLLANVFLVIEIVRAQELKQLRVRTLQFSAN